MSCNCPCNDGTVLVRVATEILSLLESGEVEPVVLLGIDKQADGTYEMILRRPPE